jgi:hypothetical protein
MRRLLATFALVLFVPGGAAIALADSEPTAEPAGARTSGTVGTTAHSAGRQRRAEDAWIAEQVHAERRARPGLPSAMRRSSPRSS